jgi:hypothetical protein
MASPSCELNTTGPAHYYYMYATTFRYAQLEAGRGGIAPSNNFELESRDVLASQDTPNQRRDG